LKEKQKLKKSTSLENIPLAEHFDLLRHYTMGQDFPIQCAIQLLKEEGMKPVRGIVSFPNSVGADTSSVVLVFATGKDAEKAKAAGAQWVGGEELIQDVLDGKVQFDRCLSTRQMFPHVIKIARVLGPKGLMPSPAKGNE
jgi:large subunit ribosomal protein L1